MVDASISGKTAVDLQAGKNLIGAFWQPSLVVADTQVVTNLPADIFAEGMAEVIKSDLIANAGIDTTEHNQGAYRPDGGQLHQDETRRGGTG